MISNEYGKIEERCEYNVFGKPYKGDLNNGVGLGYTGKPYDTVTGMYNYGYRDYSHEVARFTTVDPIRDGANWFAYVNNDPVNWIDPWGLRASDRDNSIVEIVINAWNSVLEFVAEVWHNVTEWHYEGRDGRNAVFETPTQIRMDIPENLWQREMRAIFHQDDDEFLEEKYIHPDGREVVIDGKSIADGNPQFETDSKTRGTFNYVHPGTAPEKWYDIGGLIEYGLRGIGHAVVDIVPYLILGNDR
jgi:RHS repeat-associated protein